MSLFRFISSNDASLPNIDLTNGKIDSYGRLTFDSEQELQNLCVEKTDFDSTYEDVRYYTDLPEFYEISVGDSESQIQMLLTYLQENLKPNKKYELHQIWLVNSESKKRKNNLLECAKTQHKLSANIYELGVKEIIRWFSENESVKIKLYK